MRNDRAGTGPTEEELAELQVKLGYTFRAPQLLLDALTHRSYLNERGGPGVVSNERLEFLGDAVLALVSADLVYRERPDEDEGTLTQLRVALVRASTLADFARQLTLGAYLRLGHSEVTLGGGSDSEKVMSSAFEAVLGAIYLDGGMDAARAFLDPHLRGALAQIATRQSIKDPKSRLQELAQGRLGITPRYRLASTEGPAHARSFVAEVLLGEHVAARGEGRSKQQAEQDAAQNALQDPGWNDPTA